MAFLTFGEWPVLKGTFQRKSVCTKQKWQISIGRPIQHKLIDLLKERSCLGLFDNRHMMHLILVVGIFFLIALLCSLK